MGKNLTHGPCYFQIWTMQLFTYSSKNIPNKNKSIKRKGRDMKKTMAVEMNDIVKIIKGNEKLDLVSYVRVYPADHARLGVTKIEDYEGEKYYFIFVTYDCKVLCGVCVVSDDSLYAYCDDTDTILKEDTVRYFAQRFTPFNFMMFNIISKYETKCGFAFSEEMCDFITERVNDFRKGKCQNI